MTQSFGARARPATMTHAAQRQSGEVLDGRYRLVERLGRGGFGDVWRAEELLPDGLALREVALKLLHEELAVRTDWSEEARIIASLRHPALVTIYAAGLLDLERPCPFVAMELLLGETLAEPVNRGEHVPWRRVLSWAREAAAALDEIHRAGVVHLDLKPANLFLGDGGALKVLDFGIARQGRKGPGSRAAGGRKPAAPSPGAAAAEPDLGALSTAEFVVAQQKREAGGPAPTGSVTRSVVGTPGFMAPEIFEDAEASAAADAYALAACLVQLITGQLPQNVRERPPPSAPPSAVHGWFAEVQAATVRGRIRNLRQDPARLPAALVNLLERWLALDPVARNADRGGLRAALDEVWRCPHGWVGNPYRGLSPYRVEDEGKLFGRDDDVARIGHELELQGAVVLHGAEGIGLRSLALAGVVPELARSFADGRDDWLTCLVELGDDPDGALQATLVRWLSEAPEPDPAQHAARAVTTRVERRTHGEALASEPGLGVLPDRPSDMGGDVPPDRPSETDLLGPADRPRAGSGPDGETASPKPPEAGLPSRDGPMTDSPASAAVLGRALFDQLCAWAEISNLGVVVVVVGLEHLLGAPGAKRQAAERFLGLMSSPRARRGMRLLVTLREEHTAELLALEGLGKALRPALRFLGPPPPAVVPQIVRTPARRSAMPLEDAEQVEQALQRQLREDGTRLPLASLALAAWWEACQPAGRLTGGAWKNLGGLLGALSAHAERVLGRLPELDRPVAEAILLCLVSADGTAVTVRREELVHAACEDERLGDEIASALVAERLLVHRLDGLRLAHPRLPEAWPRLRELRLRAMDRLVFLEELRLSSRRWAEEGRASSALWRGHRLRELKRREATLRLDLAADDLQFIRASRRAVVRRWAVRLAALLGVVLAAVLIVTVRDTLERRAREEEQARKEAERREAIGRMVTRSRRTADPYVHVALLGAAIGLEADDPVLPVELLSTARELPHAQFLSLWPVDRPQFPWGGRWLVGGGSGAYATVFDFTPLQDTPWGPVLHRFRPHPQGMDDLVAFPFDSSFVTRGLDGELRVWRIRLSGEIALAAVSPMRCLGGLNPVIVAERAPVVACATADGIARWDLRKVGEPRIDPFQGRVLHLSPNGDWLGAARLSRVLLWNVASNRRYEFDVLEAPSFARFSPRDDVIALVRPQGPDVYQIRPTGPERVLSLESRIEDPIDARWDERGLDLAVCGATDQWMWHYLRKGARAEGDGAAPRRAWPCEPVVREQPKRLRHVRDYGRLVSGGRRLGPRQYPGGWKLGDGRLLTRDLVLFDPANLTARQLLQFTGADSTGLPELAGPGDSAVWVERDGPERVLWQIGHEIRLYGLDGKRLLERPGNFLARCPDDRLLGWRKKDDKSWELFGARHNVHVADLGREPALILGVDATCATLFLQRLDGTLAAVDLTGSEPLPKPRALTAPGGYAFDGFVYDVRPSAASADPAISLPAGLWLAFSDGGMVRLEGPEGTIHAYGHATPRATAMADGPLPGELLFADATGVVLRERQSAHDRTLLEATGEVVWEDLHSYRDGRALLLASAERLAVLEVERHEIVDELETEPRGRFASWDDEGSVMLWASSFDGAAVGEVVPIGRGLAAKVASSVSNLSASLGPSLEVRIQASQ